MTRLPERLLSPAIRGSTHAPPTVPPLGPELDTLLAGETADSVESRILLASAAATLLSRAGYRVKKVDRPPPDPAPEEARQLVTGSPLRFLLAILEGEYPQTSREWVELAGGNGFIVPPEWLPALFNLGHRAPEHRPVLLPLLGARGPWLAQRMRRESARWVLVHESERLWASADKPAERTYVLRLLRALDPARGVALLDAHWDGEPAAACVNHLLALQPQLAHADADFLQRALEHRQWQVRLAAAHLLGFLPGSTFVQNQTFRLQECVTLARRGLRRRLVLDTTAVNSALRHAGWLTEGKRPARSTPSGPVEDAAFLLSLVPIPAWLRHLQVDLADLWRYAGLAPGDEGAVLQMAFVQSAARAREGEIARFFLVEHLPELPGLPAVLDDLAAALAPAALVEDVIIQHLNRNRKLDDDHAAIPLLHRHRQPWSAAFTRRVLETIGRPATQKTRPSPQMRTCLQNIALYANPSGGIQAIAGISTAVPGWENVLDEMRLLLEFRRGMRRAFANAQKD